MYNIDCLDVCLKVACATHILLSRFLFLNDFIKPTITKWFIKEMSEILFNDLIIPRKNKLMNCMRAYITKCLLNK